MLNQSVAYLMDRLGEGARIALVLGSGLGGLADAVEDAAVIPYAEIPGFPKPTAPGHAGRLVAGRLAGKRVLCMQGRFHFYEGHPMEALVYPVRVLRRLGVETLILTNAAGGIQPDFTPGDLMLIEDHINFMGTNPLIGPNDDTFGPRFCDMTHTYPPELRALAAEAAQRCGIPLKRGVYLACTGPSFETPAEIRAFRALGADAVGMSTVPEAIAASHCGMRVLAVSMITNLAAGVLDQPLSGEEVLAVGKQKGQELARLLTEIVRDMEVRP